MIQCRIITAMADPLSIASGIIAVLQAAESISKTLKKLKTYWAASNEVLALINEISDIRLILDEHFDVSEQLNHTQDEPKARLRQFLHDTRDKIIEIEHLIQRTGVRPDRTTAEINKFFWVRKKPQIEKLRIDLKVLRQNIAEHFDIINMWA